ncbi:hypothetical protein Afil01_39830 [Actinorhabdospora filicis]|uniref:Uncharacterized protein n=1 Tax=Actinorhabdospora filicis TaxID=1785913 RepID=A0A9W6WB30_9ACTN|nr:hypothetical protein [Actinorhabdospora filicis]GLZ79176.1 hypothetical protein Afil01_39830 [Actinorhabdospora filicis]
MGLSTSDLQVIEESLATGKNPKVVFTDAAGQIAGRIGKVMRLEEPAEGEFVTVRFGNDELPFSVADIRLPERGELSRAPRKAAEPEPATAAPPKGAPLLEERHNGVDNGTNKRGHMMSDMDSAVPHQPNGEANTSPTASPSPAPAPRKKTAPKPKGGPELTVTLQFKDDEWTVAAAKGTKVVARAVPIKSSHAVEMVRSLESPAVAALVEEIVEQARASAAEEAERLRAQLAELEARLAELG